MYALHEHFPVIPEPIRDYIEEVKAQLEEVTNSPDLPLEEKAAFLKETRHAFGRTALVLSGGGSLGAFHLGVVKALLEHGMLPRVLAGSSVGSIGAAGLGRPGRAGRLCTWGKLSAIQCNCGIESTLDACIQQVSTWERQERRKRAAAAAAGGGGGAGAGCGAPLKSRIPSWMHLPSAVAKSASQDSLAGFDNDGIYDDDDHLPLPEERAVGGPRAYFPAAAFDCIDTSANVWGGGGGGGPGSPRGAAGFATLARMHQSTDRLDAIAP
ncbi:hypothetical protein CHLNCDRAFT_144196 [Chlorella variabilis]|uniref:Patatin n=1 Tax=Chlorella variabilis TaxID=554065 RepID=E1ZC49_CHLVA|nr:hypothetical protein CHLNCDRAFT_144196 [Chlorella variabilis]EFN56547.1 hypothetical protein CHLNCDRAFT_144196 [Chlorella variabilis]|eukprot:XP_005848649.1 hypothetical protein CHLNCDRAFT_144196 [Chlorella variabilis]